MPRRVLVTGATSGIGAEAITRLLDEGWSVYASARRGEDLEALEERGCTSVPLDLTDPESIEEAASTVGTESSLEGLVHNAGIGVPGAVEDLGWEAWHQQFRVNVFGPAVLTRRLSPALRSGQARVVFVSSQAAIMPVPYYGAYCSSKRALEAVGDALRFEMGPAGVDVCMVQPGPVRTGFQGRSQALLDRFVEMEASPHEAAYARVDESIVEAAPSVSVERVVDAIMRGLTGRWVPARIPVGRLAWVGAVVASWLPEGLQDRVLRRVFEA